MLRLALVAILASAEPFDFSDEDAPEEGHPHYYPRHHHRASPEALDRRADDLADLIADGKSTAQADSIDLEKALDEAISSITGSKEKAASGASASGNLRREEKQVPAEPPADVLRMEKFMRELEGTHDKAESAGPVGGDSHMSAILQDLDGLRHRLSGPHFPALPTFTPGAGGAAAHQDLSAKTSKDQGEKGDDDDDDDSDQPSSGLAAALAAAQAQKQREAAKYLAAKQIQEADERAAQEVEERKEREKKAALERAEKAKLDALKAKGWRLLAENHEGKASLCEAFGSGPVGGHAADNPSQCIEACTGKCNTVNFRPHDCNRKICTPCVGPSCIGTVEQRKRADFRLDGGFGGYDVYTILPARAAPAAPAAPVPVAAPVPAEDAADKAKIKDAKHRLSEMRLVSTQKDAQASACAHVASTGVRTAPECLADCTGKCNTVNFVPGSCHLKACKRDFGGLMLSGAWGGHDVYTSLALTKTEEATLPALTRLNAKAEEHGAVPKNANPLPASGELPKPARIPASGAAGTARRPRLPTAAAAAADELRDIAISGGFQLVSVASSGIASSCPVAGKGWMSVKTVEECLAACAHVKAGSDGAPGCNTVNFLPNNCRLKKCQPCAEEPCWKTGVRLTGAWGGFDVYTTVPLTTPKQLKFVAEAAATKMVEAEKAGIDAQTHHVPLSVDPALKSQQAFKPSHSDPLLTNLDNAENVAAEALKYAAARAAEDRNQAVLQSAEQQREAAEQLRERQAIAAQQAAFDREEAAREKELADKKANMLLVSRKEDGKASGCETVGAGTPSRTIEHCIEDCTGICNTVNFLPGSCHPKVCKPCTSEPCNKKTEGLKLSGGWGGFDVYSLLRTGFELPKTPAEAAKLAQRTNENRAESRKVKQLQESIRLAAAAGERKMSACPQVGTKIPAGKGPVEEWKCINLCSNIPECNTINYVPGTCVTLACEATMAGGKGLHLVDVDNGFDVYSMLARTGLESPQPAQQPVTVLLGKSAQEATQAHQSSAQPEVLPAAPAPRKEASMYLLAWSDSGLSSVCTAVGNSVGARTAEECMEHCTGECNTVNFRPGDCNRKSCTDCWQSPRNCQLTSGNGGYEIYTRMSPIIEDASAIFKHAASSMEFKAGANPNADPEDDERDIVALDNDTRSRDKATPELRHEQRVYVDHGRFIGPDHEVVARQLRPEFGALAPENVSYFTLVGKSDTRLAIVAGVAQTTYFSNVIALEDAPQLVEVRWSEPGETLGRSKAWSPDDKALFKDFQMFSRPEGYATIKAMQIAESDPAVEYLWIIDQDAYFRSADDLLAFTNRYAKNNADYLVAELWSKDGNKGTRANPKWDFWDQVSGSFDAPLYGSFAPVKRVSKRLITALHDFAAKQGHVPFMDAVLPTLAVHRGLTIATLRDEDARYISLGPCWSDARLAEHPDALVVFPRPSRNGKFCPENWLETD